MFSLSVSPALGCHPCLSSIIPVSPVACSLLCCVVYRMSVFRGLASRYGQVDQHLAHVSCCPFRSKVQTFGPTRNKAGCSCMVGRYDLTHTNGPAPCARLHGGRPFRSLCEANKLPTRCARGFRVMGCLGEGCCLPLQCTASQLCVCGCLAVLVVIPMPMPRLLPCRTSPQLSSAGLRVKYRSLARHPSIGT